MVNVTKITIGNVVTVGHVTHPALSYSKLSNSKIFFTILTIFKIFLIYCTYSTYRIRDSQCDSATIVPIHINPSLNKNSHFQVANLGKFVLMWKQGSRVLTADRLVVRKDDRIRLRDDSALEISDLRAEDQVGAKLSEAVRSGILALPLFFRVPTRARWTSWANPSPSSTRSVQTKLCAETNRVLIAVPPQFLVLQYYFIRG